MLQTAVHSIYIEPVGSKRHEVIPAFSWSLPAPLVQPERGCHQSLRLFAADRGVRMAFVASAPVRHWRVLRLSVGMAIFASGACLLINHLC